jgi:DNA polymerase (family 10)
MKNKEVAELLFKIAELLNIAGENPFKIRAYERASQMIDTMAEPIEQAINTKIPGIGDGIKEKIVEYLDTDNSKYYDELKQKLPEGLLQLIEIPGLGPKKAKLIYDKLGITSIDGLRKAAKDSKLRALPGLGEKTEQNILQGIEFKEKSKGRVLLDKASALADDIISILNKNADVDKLTSAGSLRRKKETIGDIDILCTAANDKDTSINDTFTSMPIVDKVLAKGTTKSSIMTKSGIQVDLRVVDQSHYGAALQYFTGSKEHNVVLRELAIKHGYTLNEYGLFEFTDKTKTHPVAGKTEQEIYKKLNLQYIPPELRENRGEIELAKEHKLPALVELADIKGDLHVHSTYSDGHNTIAELVERAEQLGYEWLVISDHSQSLKIARGLSEKELLLKIDEIKNLNKKTKVKILAGTEVDILSDGKIDYPDSVLKQLDFVICGVHSSFKQPEQQMTDRVKRAFENKYVHAMSHPSGRLLLTRDAYKINEPLLLEYAKQYDVALEINAHPIRLDLTDVYCKKAKEMGIKLCIGSDAHYMAELEYMKYGVYTAQRGWLEKNDIMNSMGYEELVKFLNKKR